MGNGYCIRYALKLSDPEVIVGVRLYESSIIANVLLLAFEDLSDDGRDVLKREIFVFDEAAAIPIFQGLAETVSNGELWKTTEVAFSDTEQIELMSDGNETISYPSWKGRFQSHYRWKDYGNIRMLLYGDDVFGGEIVPTHEAVNHIAKNYTQRIYDGLNPCGELYLKDRDML